MSKIGRNDPCPCGSGKKFKNCCISKLHTLSDNIDNKNLLRIEEYGWEFYEIEQLNVFDRFFIKTTENETFEVRKNNKEYIIKDIIPPVNEIRTKKYKTIDLDESHIQRLLGTDEIITNLSEFDGVVKGGHFAWLEGKNDYISTKGKMEKLYVKQFVNNSFFDIHLFPLDVECKSIDDFIDEGFSIITENNRFDFEMNDDLLTFEDYEVVAILSLYDTESLNVETMFSDTSVYNVSFDIAVGKPFTIFRIKDNKLTMSLINEKVVDIYALNSAENQEK